MDSIENIDNINTPEMSQAGKVTVKSITSGEQAYGIADKLERDNQPRNDLNAVILRKYNGGQPYEPKALVDNGEDWRSNAPTGFMSSIVDRITPTPMQSVDSARYLTNASLSNKAQEAAKKSEYFRTAVTKAIRSWDGWRDFLSSMFQELVLIGYVAPLNLNPYTPWPKVFTGDQVFFPEGVGQFAKTIPMMAAKEDLLIHDFASAFMDGPEIASGAGWHWDNCIKALNEALPRKIGTSQEPNDARQWEDAVREANVGASHSGAKIVKLYHALGVEVDTKKVTHYIVNRDGNHEILFSKEERFDCIDDVATLLTLQPANGKYYSSKGIGRITLNLHISIERARNGMLDNLHLAGLKVIKVAPGQASTFQQRLTGPFLIVSADGDFDQHGIQTTVAEFIQADDQISRWAEQLVGSYISGLHAEEGGGTKTAREVTVEANRDAQAKSAFLSRALGQLAYLISQITRRLCDPETTDQIAKDLQEELKDPERGNLSKEEIDELKKAPAAEVVQDLTQMLNQQIVAIFPVLKGDPNIEQQGLYERFLSASVSPEFMKDVLLTEEASQAKDAMAVRQQMMETEAMHSGAPGMPVVPNDDHENHLKTVFSDMKAGLPKIAKLAPTQPKVLDDMNTSLVHSDAHIKTWKSQGAPPEQIKPYEDAQKMFEGLLQNLGESVQNAQKQQAEAQQGPQEAPQGPVAAPDGQGAPMGPGGASPLSNPDILKSWIGQYANLPPAAKAALEKFSGLEAVEQTIQPEPAPMPVPSPQPPPPAQPSAPSISTGPAETA